MNNNTPARNAVKRLRSAICYTRYMNRKGFTPVLIIGIVALVVIAATVGWYLVARQNAAAPAGVACTQEAKQCPDGSYVGRTGPDCAFAACPGVATQASSTTATVASSTASSTVDTSDWQTFADSQYDVTAKYPADWYLNQSIAAGDPSDTFDSFPWDERAHGAVVSVGNAEITIYRSLSTLQEMMDSQLSGENTTGSAITVGGVQGLEAFADTYDSDAKVDQKSIDVFIPYDGFVYNISLYDYGDPQSVDIFDTFLNSIQFTQPVVDASDWKTYDMQGSGVGFSYPLNWTVSVLNSSTVGLFSPSSTDALRSGNVETSFDISVSVIGNSQGLSLENFVNSYQDGWFTNYASSTAIGSREIIKDDSTDIAPATPVIAAFLQTGLGCSPEIVVVTLTNPPNAQQRAEFNAIVNSAYDYICAG
jgi:hypothetical protein